MIQKKTPSQFDVAIIAVISATRGEYLVMEGYEASGQVYRGSLDNCKVIRDAFVTIGHRDTTMFQENGNPDSVRYYDTWDRVNGK